MSNYVKTKDFAAADALATGNAAKAIKGVDIGLEFDNIATAVATKLNSAGNETLGSLYMTGATGAGQGAGTINATALYINGVGVATGAGAGATVFGTGTATLSCAAILVGQTYTVWRSATASVSSNAVPALDAVLQLTALPAGTYRINVNAAFSSASATPGATVGVAAVSGTNAAPWLFAQVFGSGGSLASGAAGLTSSLLGLGGNTGTQAQINGLFTVLTTLTLGFYWSQAASNATATVLQGGSFFSVTRIS